MTLEEKFESDGNYEDNQIYTYGCVKIAEEFAIEFAQWCVVTQAFGLYGFEGALKVFKKEKEL